MQTKHMMCRLNSHGMEFDEEVTNEKNDEEIGIRWHCHQGDGVYLDTTYLGQRTEIIWNTRCRSNSKRIKAISWFAENWGKKAIASLMFLTKKQDGTIKARATADGCKQHKYMEKIKSASPTVMIESIFTTVAIDVKEERKEVSKNGSTRSFLAWQVGAWWEVAWDLSLRVAWF